MAVTDLDKIDFIGIKDKTAVALSISDHLDWSDTFYHLKTLQEKINAYIAFIETGALLEAYPNAKGKDVEIHIVSEYNLSEEGKEFIEKVKSFLEPKGISVIQKTIIAW